MNRDEQKKATPNIARLASLKDFNGVLLGRDMGELFKDGHVYEAREILGTIVFTDLGEHALYYAGSTISQYATSGLHCLTKEEYEREQSKE